MKHFGSNQKTFLWCLNDVILLLLNAAGMIVSLEKQIEFLSYFSSSGCFTENVVIAAIVAWSELLNFVQEKTKNTTFASKSFWTCYVLH